MAQLFPYFIDCDPDVGPVNLSSGVGVTIQQLAITIAELIGFSGEVGWNTDKPDGQMEKVFSIRKMKTLGLTAPTDIRSGLKRTLNWFLANYAHDGDGIRL